MEMSAVKLVLGVCIPFVLLTLWAIIDAAQRDFGGIEKKAAWLLVAAVPFVGAVVYLLFGMRRGQKK